MSIVRTSPKGQVVVPAELRGEIGLEPGDLVRVTHAGGRRVMIEPVGSDPVGALRGMLQDGPSLTAALAEERTLEDARDAEKRAGLVRHPRPPQRRKGRGRGR